MRILLTGGSGQVGWELRRALSPLGSILAPGRETMDLGERDRVRQAVREAAPDLIVNAAAYTAVDRAETEAEEAHAVNAAAPGVLADAAREAGAPLVHYSTDYVFDGEKGAPYVEEDPTRPLNAYGRTKLEGERAVRDSGAAHLILRTSWVFGTRRDGFVSAMLEQFRTRDTARAVVDRTGSPTWCRALAEATALIVARLAGTGPLRDAVEAHGGVYHLAAAGEATRYALAAAILEILSARGGARTRELREATDAEFDSAVARPRYSVLDSGRAERAFGVRLPHWREQLRLCLEEL